MHRTTSQWIGLVAIVAITAGCTNSDNNTSAVAIEHPTVPNVIVEAQWLHQHLGDERLTVVDARTPDEYAKGHIDGAVNIPTNKLLDTTVNKGDLAPVNVIQSVLGEAGIDMDQTVIIYDDKNYRDGARVFWALEVHGHPSVAVLNGGYGKWAEAGLPTSQNPAQPARRQFVAHVRPERLATKLSVLRALDEGNAVILDSRSSEEYQGLKSEANRKGHIAKAINIDFNRNMVFDKQGACSLKFSDELLDLYRAELSEAPRVICYCNSGNRASVSYLALRSIGFNTAVYDGSWVEWGNDPELPIE